MVKKLMLLDGNSLVNRAYYGLNSRYPLTAPDGTPTGALYAFLNMYFRYFDDIKPDYVCVAFDLKGPTFRHESYADYKGTRKPMPEDLAMQIPLLKEILDKLGIARMEIPGYEADDIIGTLADLAEKEHLETAIVTGDKDSFQLVSSSTKIHLPLTRGGQSKTELVDPDYVLAHYKVKPEQMIDIKAIMGDAADNIPGVRGIGEKGAISLISKYGSLENVYDKLHELTPGQADKLTKSKELAFLSKDLSRIHRHIPMEQSPKEFIVAPPDQAELLALFTKYGFKSLIERLGLDQDILDESTNRDDVKHIVFTDVNKWWQELNNRCLSALDADKSATLDLPLFCQLVGSSFWLISCMNKDATFLTIYAENNHAELTILFENIEKLITDKGNASTIKTFLIGFDLKQLLKTSCLNTAIFKLNDLMIAGYLLGQLEGKPDFARLFLQVTGEIWQEDLQELGPISTKKPKEIGLFDQDTAYKIKAVSFDENKSLRLLLALQKIYQQQNSIFAKNKEFSSLMFDLEMPLLSILSSMEKTGFLLDQTALASLSVEMQEHCIALETQIFALGEQKLNLNSPKQLSNLLFDQLNLPPGKKLTSGYYSTNNDELERLREKHPIIPLIIEYRLISKLKSTFVEGLAKAVDVKDQRVHTTFSQVQTATGRLSSSEPNLQNIPIRSAMGMRIREVFVAAPGHVLLDADYSQIELRLLAHLSQDEAMLAAFNENQDIHTNTACHIFGLPPQMITPEQRSIGKTVNFSIVYGISDFGLARDLHIPVKEAAAYIASYNKQYPTVREYLNGQIKKAYDLGYVETIFGRRRYIGELKSPKHSIRKFGERAAMNAPVQGTAADIIKKAMVAVYEEFTQNKLKSRLILQVHDELIVETPEEELSVASAILQACMEDTVKLTVPIITEVRQGKNWAECK